MSFLPLFQRSFFFSLSLVSPPTPCPFCIYAFRLRISLKSGLCSFSFHPLPLQFLPSLKSNVDRYKVLNAENNNHNIQYFMNSRQLFTFRKEKYLEILITNNLYPKRHCSKVVKTTNKLIG